MVQPGMDDSGLVRGLGAVGGALYQYGDLRRQIQQERSRALLENIDRQFREREFEAQRTDSQRNYDLNRENANQEQTRWSAELALKRLNTDSLVSNRGPQTAEDALLEDARERLKNGQMSASEYRQLLLKIVGMKFTTQGDMVKTPSGAADKIGGYTPSQFDSKARKVRDDLISAEIRKAGVSSIAGLSPLSVPENIKAMSENPTLRPEFEALESKYEPYRKRIAEVGSVGWMDALHNNSDSQKVYLHQEFSPRTAANQNISLARNFVQSQPDTNRTADTSNYQYLKPNHAAALRQLDAADAERQSLREAPMNEARAKLQYVQQWAASYDQDWNGYNPVQREKMISFLLANPDFIKKKDEERRLNGQPPR